MSKPPRVLNRDDTNKLIKLIDFVCQDKDSVEFRKPVDWRGLGLDDYLKIIQKPMDLSTVKARLKKSRYKDIQSVLNDLDLIWSNCRQYNMPESQIVKQANNCQRLVKKYLKQLKINELTEKESVPSQEKLPSQVLQEPLPALKTKRSHSQSGDENVANENVSIVEKKVETIQPEPINNIPQQVEEQKQEITFLQKTIMSDKFYKLHHNTIKIIIELVSNECSKAIEHNSNEQLKLKLDELDYQTYLKVDKQVILCRIIEEALNAEEQMPVKKKKLN